MIPLFCIEIKIVSSDRVIKYKAQFERFSSFNIKILKNPAKNPEMKEKNFLSSCEILLYKHNKP